MLSLTKIQSAARAQDVADLAATLLEIRVDKKDVKALQEIAEEYKKLETVRADVTKMKRDADKTLSDTENVRAENAALLEALKAQKEEISLSSIDAEQRIMRAEEKEAKLVNDIKNFENKVAKEIAVLDGRQTQLDKDIAKTKEIQECAEAKEREYNELLNGAKALLGKK